MPIARAAWLTTTSRRRSHGHTFGATAGEPRICWASIVGRPAPRAAAAVDRNGKARHAAPMSDLNGEKRSDH